MRRRSHRQTQEEKNEAGKDEQNETTLGNDPNVDQQVSIEIPPRAKVETETTEKSRDTSSALSREFKSSESLERRPPLNLPFLYSPPPPPPPLPPQLTKTTGKSSETSSALKESESFESLESITDVRY